MVLIDALHINTGGGKVLLDYLIEQLEKTDKKITYLLDDRIRAEVPEIKKSNNVIFLKANLVNRLFFYKKNNSKFVSILCFGNLPPYKKCVATVYTYFHQLLFLEKPENFSVLQKIIFKLKVGVLRIIRNNTNYWLVQSSAIKAKLAKKIHINDEKIKVLPFYPPLTLNEKLERVKNSFLYVSNATPNKNHKRLIDAFCVFSDKYKRGILTVTVSNKYLEIQKIIDERISENYPIKNVGFVERENLAELYKRNEYLIYPSLAESFGLGIVEAIDNGCNVIGADLPYTYAVCEPSITFDPLNIQSIEEAFEEADKNEKKSISLVQNRINDIIKLL